MSNKEKILELYFDKKMKQIDISKILGISQNAVSKTLKLDDRFQKEKDNRKQINKKIHNKVIQNSVENKRKILKEKNDNDFYILKEMHKQASIELSGGKKTIGDIAYRNWNKSAYKFDKNRKSYILRKEINAGYDVPKKIIWK